jgi:beta-glucanase (GH16 family)
VATNTTGVFEYTFVQTGYYQVDIRAYGSSGRYIKDSRQISVTLGNGVGVDDGYISPLTYEGYTLVWNDEFDGTTINSSNWAFEIGTGSFGWGNNELEYYRQENAWVDEGVLTIEARRESYSGSSYTSSRMKTQNKLSFQYGRIDIRALLPEGQGIWPALWMLGNNITSVGWPQCGEIDIMEMVGGDGRENQTHGTAHWDNNGHVYVGGSYTLQTGIFADEYHVFSIIWDQTSIKWLVNNNQFYEIDITPSYMSEFHQKHFFIFNVAVGGNWPGSPDGTTIFPQQMKVDYIRVFQ